VERIAEWVGIIDHGKLLLEGRLDDMRANFRRVRVVGESLPLAAWPDIVSANTGEGTTEYVVRDNADAFAVHLQSQGATVLDVTPLNLSEIFLEVVGKGKTNVSMEVLA
jgi:ABC-2 type transport system ATP-binding protein